MVDSRFVHLIGRTFKRRALRGGVIVTYVGTVRDVLSKKHKKNEPPSDMDVWLHVEWNDGDKEDMSLAEFHDWDERDRVIDMIEGEARVKAASRAAESSSPSDVVLIAGQPQVLQALDDDNDGGDEEQQQQQEGDKLAESTNTVKHEKHENNDEQMSEENNAAAKPLVKRRKTSAASSGLSNVASKKGSRRAKKPDDTSTSATRVKKSPLVTEAVQSSVGMSQVTVVENVEIVEDSDSVPIAPRRAQKSQAQSTERPVRAARVQAAVSLVAQNKKDDLTSSDDNASSNDTSLTSDDENNKEEPPRVQPPPKKPTWARRTVVAKRVSEKNTSADLPSSHSDATDEGPAALPASRRSETTRLKSAKSDQQPLRHAVRAVRPKTKANVANDDDTMDPDVLGKVIFLTSARSFYFFQSSLTDPHTHTHTHTHIYMYTTERRISQCAGYD